MPDLIVTVPSDTLILPESVIVPAARIPDLPGGGGGAVSSVNGETGAVTLSAADVGAAPALGADDNYVTDAEKASLHTHPAVIAQGATAADARAAIGAGTSSFSGAYADLSGKPTLGTAAAAATTDFATAAQGTDARTPTAHTHPASEISDSTAAGRTILTAADAAAQRTALGLSRASVPMPPPAAAGQYVPIAAAGSTYATFSLMGGRLVPCPQIIETAIPVDAVSAHVESGASAGVTLNFALYTWPTAGDVSDWIADLGSADASTNGAKVVTFDARTLVAGGYLVVLRASATLTMRGATDAIGIFRDAGPSAGSNNFKFPHAAAASFPAQITWNYDAGVNGTIVPRAQLRRSS